MRLRLKQERPSTLQKALEIALELESFQIASRQRYRVIRNVRIEGEKQGYPPGRVAVGQKEGDGTSTQVKELVECMEELKSGWRSWKWWPEGGDQAREVRGRRE